MPQITLELITKFQGGINRKVFEYLTQNDNYLLIYIEAKLEEDIKKHGQSFTHELPVEKIVNYIKGLPNWNVQMLSLTHDCKNENHVAEFVSRI